jgi:hypothetical protein
MNGSFGTTLISVGPREAVARGQAKNWAIFSMADFGDAGPISAVFNLGI